MKEQTATMTAAEIERQANEILRRHGLFSIPVDPVLLANREGIKVNNAVFSDTTISGIVAKRGGTTLFLVNQNDPPYRKRFTIAHELGHHFLHLAKDGEFVDHKIDLFRDAEVQIEQLSAERRMEIQANQFAAALLMPEELVRAAFQSTPDLLDLARAFNVSETAMGIRLSRLGLG